MKTKDKNLQHFVKCARYNSGTHFLDSGGSNGRHWQNPVSPDDIPLVKFDEFGSEINTAKFLAEHLEVDEKLQKQFMKYANLEENKKRDWHDCLQSFMYKKHSLKQRCQDNSYNYDNDLSQNFIVEVYNDETYKDYFEVDDSTLTAIYIHTGADVRGGYSYPLITRSKTDYSFPHSMCAEYRCIEERGADCGDFPELLSEKWECGYSSYPFGELEQDTQRFFLFPSREPDTFVAKLKEGALAKVVACAPIY
tara:strand:+ start:77 stop:829 length:753 start_codon:yes stop_codon:yes gene_type:complete